MRSQWSSVVVLQWQVTAAASTAGGRAGAQGGTQAWHAGGVARVTRYCLCACLPAGACGATASAVLQRTGTGTYCEERREERREGRGGAWTGIERQVAGGSKGRGRVLLVAAAAWAAAWRVRGCWRYGV